ncbi:trace amine-associated receptor 1-like [Latimeria chalumnae]|uniref:Trace amine-associated receptor 1 n=1 Tax=Latimeria chalumnae TaxID=7897 RepID=H2ZYL3_LATCH|nr:PREDICTED: trace amine-associated receptor 1-like [Latimeria chalumnae]XP_006010956.1 PREDICTED: trace amine-associated receptor 1-like [Latimeria chalumnae]|eukprot:XP_006010955.1 PREDICTED: trace amine-associated receptor 1-like [Latimeria chalumnae]
MSAVVLEIPRSMQYCFENVNESCPRTVRGAIIRIPMYIFMLSTISVTICGNLVVIVSIAHFRQLHTPTNYLILSLATVDFLLAIFVMPYSMVRSVETCWYFGDLFCKIHSSIDIMLSTASIFHLSFISIDRYYAVCDPLRYKTKITAFVTLIMISMSWIVSAVFAFGMIFLDLNIKGDEDFYYQYVVCAGGCIVFFTKTSGVVASLFSFYIPGVIMVCIYGKIYLVARDQARSIEDVEVQTAEQNRGRVSKKRERKAAKTLGIVVGVFLFCWSPFFVCNLMDPFLNYKTPSLLFDALIWFGYLNSACNPIVYGFFYTWFQKALKVIISGRILHRDSSRLILFSD